LKSAQYQLIEKKNLIQSDPFTLAVIKTLITRINMPMLGIKGTKNFITFDVFTYIASQLGDDIGTASSVLKNDARTVAATRKQIPYDIMNTITDNPRNTRLLPLLFLGLKFKITVLFSFFSLIGGKP